jgi:hypothetical protein
MKTPENIVYVEYIKEETTDIAKDFMMFLEWFNPLDGEQYESRQSNNIQKGEKETV